MKKRKQEQEKQMFSFLRSVIVDAVALICCFNYCIISDDRNKKLYIFSLSRARAVTHHGLSL